MSLDYIRWKLNEYNSKRADSLVDPPTRIILGRKTYQELKGWAENYFSNVSHVQYTNLVDKPYGEFMGMKISLSKRPNYVRILPAKLNYRYLRPRKLKIWKPKYILNMVHGTIIAQPNAIVGIQTV